LLLTRTLDSVLGPLRSTLKTTARVINFLKTFYFEIITDAQEVAKRVQTEPMYPPPTYPPMGKAYTMLEQ